MSVRLRRDWLELFRRAVREMRYHSPVYKMLKEELGQHGHGYWRNKPRGKPDAENLRGRKEEV